jgi:hypothetical protein
LIPDIARSRYPNASQLGRPALGLAGYRSMLPSASPATAQPDTGAGTEQALKQVYVRNDLRRDAADQARQIRPLGRLRRGRLTLGLFWLRSLFAHA